MVEARISLIKARMGLRVDKQSFMTTSSVKTGVQGTSRLQAANIAPVASDAKIGLTTVWLEALVAE